MTDDHPNHQQPQVSSTPAPARPAGGDQRGPAPDAQVSITRRPWFLPTAVDAAALVIGLVGGIGIGAFATRAIETGAGDAAEADADAAKDEYFRGIQKRCNASSTTEVADGGRTLIIDGEGEDAFSGEVSFTQLDCLIDQLGTPRATKQLMLETRSLDGRQSGAWADKDAGVELSASWSYHPDNGLDLIVELVG